MDATKKSVRQLLSKKYCQEKKDPVFSVTTGARYQPARKALLFTAILMTSLFFSACVGDVLVCECVVCIEDGAVLLSVEDSTGNEVEDFVVELVLNEVSVGQPANCTPEERDGSNSCTFGSELGFYHIIVTAPGYERRELAVRVFDEGQREVCCRACLSAREVTVSLQPR